MEEITPLEMWLIFFEYADDKENHEIVNRILEIKEEIGVAGTLLQSISKDEFERARFLSRRKFINDMESNMIGAKEEGREEGRIEIAKKMLKKGFSFEDIADTTELPLIRIQELAKELRN